MNKLIVIIFTLILYSAAYAQSDDWLWATKAGGTGTDLSYGIATDSSGNSYVTGYFYSTAIFGGTTLTSSGSAEIFIAKLDPSGNYIWAKKAGGTNGESGRAIATDSSGNSFVTGDFSGTASFGSTAITSSGGSDIFIAKLDTDGNYLWAKKAGGTSSDNGYGIATDSNGNSYITGSFYGTANFGSISITSSGSMDIFIAKLDTSGNFLWAKKAGGTSSEIARAIATDSNGNSFLTGEFYGTASFGSTILTSSGNYDIFVTSLDTSGNYLWAKKAGGTSSDDSFGIATDSTGNSYITGNFYGTASFGSISITSSGMEDIFIAKLDVSGNYLWAKQAGGTVSDYGYGIACDSNGNSYVTGCFYGTAIFGSTTLTGSGGHDFFVTKLDASGNYLWAKQAGGTSDGYGYDIATDSSGNGYVTGMFSGTAILGSTGLTISGDADVFICKIGVLTGVIAPNGGEIWQSGCQQTVFWNFVNAGEHVNIMFSDNNGSSWTMLNDIPVLALLGRYAFIVPSISSAECLIKVESASNSDLYDISNAPFTVGSSGTSSVLQMSSQYVDFGIVYLGSSSVVQELWLANTGTADMEISALSFGQVNSVFEILGVTLPINISLGDSVALQLRFTPQSAGAVTDSLYIQNNSQNVTLAAIRLSGTGQYVPPKPPENVVVVMDGTNTVISWEAVTETIYGTPIVPDYYLIFFNGSADPEGVFYYHGASMSLQYTHYLVGMHSAHMFYRVIAYKNYSRGSTEQLLHHLQQDMTIDEVARILNR